MANRARIISKRIPLGVDERVLCLNERCMSRAKYEFLVARGDWFYAQGKFSRSQVSYFLASRLKNLYCPQIRRLGLALLAVGAVKQAFVVYARCFETDAWGDADVVNYVFILRELNGKGNALQKILNFEKLYQVDSAKYFAKKYFALKCSSWNDELKGLSEKISFYKRQARHDFLMMQGERFKVAKILTRCRSAYRLAYRCGFNRVEASRQLGLAELDFGNPVDALKLFLQCLQLHRGSDPLDYLNISLCYVSVGQFVKAKDIFHRIPASIFRKSEYQNVLKFISEKIKCSLVRA
jgi:tetratricopeptide (TPR) repeat protein